MDLERDQVPGRLPGAPDFHHFEYHHVLVADEGFFHGEVGIADGADPDQRVLLERIRMQGDEDRLALVDDILAARQEGEDRRLLGILGEHGERVDHHNLRLAAPDVAHDPLENAVHLLLRPLEPHHVEVEEPDVSPGKVIGDIEAHGLHLGEEALRCQLGGVEINAQPLLHGPPHDLLGKHAFPGIVLALYEGEGA